MKNLLLALALLVLGQNAHACQLYTLEIEATVSGTEIRDGVCIVNVIVDQVSPQTVCQLRSVRPESEIKVSVRNDQLENGCPQDEGYTLKGRIISNGDIYRLLTGTVQ